MFGWLKDWFSQGRPASVLNPSQGMEMTHRYDDLRNDFSRRTWEFEYLAACVTADTDLRLLHWVGSVDRSGYTREACLRWLIENFRLGDENRILLRLADWVPEVRAVAREWVLKNFAGLPFGAMRENARLILHLSRRQTLVGDPGMKCIEQTLLARAGSIPADEFLALGPKFRRYLYARSLDGDQALRERIPRDPEPFNRLLLLNQPGGQPPTTREIDALRSDRSAVVRRRLLSYRVASGEKPGREELVEFALDPHPGVRELGRFHLQRIHGVDAEAIYRAKSGPEFYYIADFARPEDVEHFLRGVESSHRATRTRCLRALARADRMALSRLDLAALLRIGRREKRILLPCLPGLFTVEEIIALRPAIEGVSPAGTVSYLRTLAAKSWWHFIDAALTEQLADPSGELTGFVHGEVQRRTQVFDEPSEDLRLSIREKLAAARRQNPHALWPLIEFTLG